MAQLKIFKDSERVVCNYCKAVLPEIMKEFHTCPGRQALNQATETAMPDIRLGIDKLTPSIILEIKRRLAVVEVMLLILIVLTVANIAATLAK